MITVLSGELLLISQDGKLDSLQLRELTTRTVLEECPAVHVSFKQACPVSHYLHHVDRELCIAVIASGCCCHSSVSLCIDMHKHVMHAHCLRTASMQQSAKELLQSFVELWPNVLVSHSWVICRHYVYPCPAVSYSKSTAAVNETHNLVVMQYHQTAETFLF